MKLHATKKQITENYKTVLKVGYCGLQSLLNYQSPFAYNAGTYGWNCDFYKVGNVIISTGYRPVGQSVNYDLIHETEKIAESINCNYSLSYDERKYKIDILLKEFIQKAMF